VYMHGELIEEDDVRTGRRPGRRYTGNERQFWEQTFWGE